MSGLTERDHLIPRMKEQLSSKDSYLQAPPPLPKIEKVHHPSHYNVGKYEVIDVIEDWKMGFNLGNVVKYVARADHKGEANIDLYKALFYLNREIANRERGLPSGKTSKN